MAKRTHNSILDELQTIDATLSAENGLLSTCMQTQYMYMCNIVKTCLLGMMPGRRGRPRMQYIDNIKKWARASLEQNVRVT